jgi:hypothetical protein
MKYEEKYDISSEFGRAGMPVSQEFNDLSVVN